MNLMRDRSPTEIALFAAAAFGIWLSIWGIILTSVALDAVAVVITLAALIGFALRDAD
jgi:hypothetical protein